MLLYPAVKTGILAVWASHLHALGANDEIITSLIVGSTDRRTLCAYARMFGETPRWWWSSRRLARIWWSGMIGDGRGMPPRGSYDLRLKQESEE